eukprot:gene22348-28468_t
MFNGDDEQNNANAPTEKTYTFEDQVFSEIEVDETPPEDDESVTWTDAGHKDSVYCIAAHPTQPGVVITGGGDDIAYIWKVETGELIQTLEGPEDVEWAEWHSKGNAVIAGSRDGSIWMWLTQNGQCVQVFAGHDGPVSSGCFSTDGKLVCSGGEDGTVRLWLPKTGACKHVFEGHFGHDAMVTSMACHVDGDLLLSGSADGTMKLFQLSGKKVLQKFVHSDPSALPEPGSVPAPNVFSQMTTIAEGRGGDMDDENDEEGGDMGAGPETEALSAVECVGFAKGGLKWVASGGMDKNLKVWDMTTGSCRCICAHGGSVVALKWHDTLPIVCTAALDNVIRIWDARNGNMLAELTGHKDLVTNLDLLSVKGVDGVKGITDAIVTVSDDKTSRVFLIDMNSLLA